LSGVTEQTYIYWIREFLEKHEAKRLLYLHHRRFKYCEEAKKMDTPRIERGLLATTDPLDLLQTEVGVCTLHQHG
jgi:hypothetical protein